MSSVNCASNTSENLQFEAWLVQQISSGNFKDLEWIDADQQRIFKLPWTKKNYPDWEEHHKIFKAWAEYRSVKRNDPQVALQPVSTMKSNFRTVLRKCSYIEELKNFHQLGLQTGNYKVYKILTNDEVASKRQRPEMLQSIPTYDASNDIVEITSISGQASDVQLMTDSEISPWLAKSTSLCVALLEAKQLNKKRSAVDEDSGILQPDFKRLKRRKTQATQTRNMLDSAKEIVFLNDNISVSNHETQSDDENSGDICKTEEHVGNADGFTILLEAAEINSDSQSFSSQENIITEVARFNSSSSITQFLQSLNMTTEQLHSCDVLIKYGGQNAWVGQYCELDKGYLIHNGACGASMKSRNTEKFIPFSLPSPTKDMGRFFDAAMTNMNDGLLLSLDSSYNLVLTRLCLSRVFVSAHFGDFDVTDNFALDRHNQVIIFNYKKFLSSLSAKTQEKETIPLSKLKVFISIGKKWQSDIEHSKVYIGLQLIPNAAEVLLKLMQQMQEIVLS